MFLNPFDYLFRGRLALAAAATIFLTGVASAQPVATSFEQLHELVKSGDTIHVTDSTGRTTKGKLGNLSSASLELLVRKAAPDGRETFLPEVRLSEAQVRQILLQRRDPVWKGMLIGAAVVGGPWLLICNPSTDWCEYGDGENLFRAAALMTTAIGAGIGALIDAAINQRTMIYYRPPTPGAPTVRVSPVASPSEVGFQMSVRF